MKVLSAGEGKQVRLPEMLQTVKVEGDDVDGAFAFWEATIKGGPGPHIHHTDTEVLYVLEGEVEFTAGREVARLGPGGCVMIPKGTVHSFRTLGNRHVRQLVLVAPAGFEHFFEELAALLQAGVDIKDAVAVAGEEHATTFIRSE